MDGLIETFHIDIKIIIAQLVNFAIVFAVLYYFAFKPLGKLMRERKNEIEKGLSDAQKSKEELSSALERSDEEIKKGKAKANEIITEAKKKGDEIIGRAQEKAEEEAQKIISQAQLQLEKEREQMEKELLEKTAGLVTLGVQKILDTDVDEETNEEINKRALELLKQSS